MLSPPAQPPVSYCPVSHILHFHQSVNFQEDKPCALFQTIIFSFSVSDLNFHTACLFGGGWVAWVRGVGRGVIIHLNDRCASPSYTTKQHVVCKAFLWWYCYEGLLLSGVAWGPRPAWSTSQTAGVRGGLFPHTAVFFALAVSVLPAAALMSGTRNVENRTHWGALFSQTE